MARRQPSVRVHEPGLFIVKLNLIGKVEHSPGLIIPMDTAAGRRNLPVQAADQQILPVTARPAPLASVANAKAEQSEYKEQRRKQQQDTAGHSHRLM